MIMSELFEISIRCRLDDKFQRTEIIDLYFTKPPSMYQIIEATRHYLLNQDISRHVGLQVMSELQSIKGTAPGPEDYLDQGNITIYNSKTFLFTNGEEDEY